MTYSLWQSDDRRYSLGGRVRSHITQPRKMPLRPPADWTNDEMERLDLHMQETARQLAIRATRAHQTEPAPQTNTR